MDFNYYYGSQADQFSFIRIPKVMLTEKLFSPLSIQAKVLYGVLLDRMSLSRKNSWFDEENKVFIIYQIGEIQQDLGFTKRKAMDLLSELEEFGLLEKKRRGHGLPNILYVKSFMTGIPALGGAGSDPKAGKAASNADRAPCRDATISSVSEVNDYRSVKNCTSPPVLPLSRSTENITSRSVDFSTLEVPEQALLKVSDSALQEVRESAPLKNKTEINQTEMIHIESNHISTGSGNPFCALQEKNFQQGETRYDEKRSEDDPLAIALEYRELIRENINYDDLLRAHPKEPELVEGIAELILETVLCRTEYILIASNSFPTEIVRSKFLKLDYWHVEYVIRCLKENTTRIRNIKKYLLASLFNAPSTIEGFYRAEVNHDFSELITAHAQ